MSLREKYQLLVLPISDDRTATRADTKPYTNKETAVTLGQLEKKYIDGLVHDVDRFRDEELMLEYVIGQLPQVEDEKREQLRSKMLYHRIGLFFRLLNTFMSAQRKDVRYVSNSFRYQPSEDETRFTLETAVHISRSTRADGKQELLWIYQQGLDSTDRTILDKRRDTVLKAQRAKYTRVLSGCDRLDNNHPTAEAKDDAIEKLRYTATIPVETIDIFHQLNIPNLEHSIGAGLRINRYLDGFQAFPLIWQSTKPTAYYEVPLIFPASAVTIPDAEVTFPDAVRCSPETLRRSTIGAILRKFTEFPSLSNTTRMPHTVQEMFPSPETQDLSL